MYVSMQNVWQDASLRLCVTKLVGPDQLVVVLFLTNQKQAPLSGVCLSLKPSSNLLVSYICSTFTYFYTHTHRVVLISHTCDSLDALCH